MNTPSSPAHFIRNIIEEDNRTGKWNGRVETRFPPEPNGYLHIGHAKSICLNFGLALEYGGVCHLRFDDTNPEKEAQEYVDAIIESVRWLGFDWKEHLYYASDYFDQLYEFAEYLITQGKAYVDSLSADEIRRLRGTLTEAGTNSPYRDRSAEENLDLFRRMRAGEFPDGVHVLRARIDMASPNINLRDPVIYRIRHIHHQRTGDKWCIYPMYDYTHCISDALERITHSLCTLEFEDHRPLYDWVLDQLAEKIPCHPQQIEFARLNLTYSVMSKRKLIDLVENKLVDGWNDPRMNTLAGLRRRGYTPESIRLFAERIGISKADSWIDMTILEDCLREDLNERALRRIAVLDPVSLIIDNFPDGHEETCYAPNHPQKPELGTRELRLTKQLYIDREDFMEIPNKGFFRLAPGAEVRLRYAFIIKCTHVVKDDQGKILEIHCVYDPDTKSGTAGAETRKVRGNIHWLSATYAKAVEIRLYDRLFIDSHPDTEGKDFKISLNPNSKEVITGYVEPSLCEAQPEQRFQFERHGYFVADLADTGPGKPIFNRTVSLRNTWKK
ncbi:MULTISPECIES: glutamine--tRNA ligase/YqeY domain fusion protein [Nitrosomonas]|uniref:Glutamine--tRNA ligase n=1 Tax=Nitrosomonas europaea (strain ATCC 19718 / CIP 103999 / KCTC 2705 / NBRC 14298) TaxID=228410 RepID=SYQ_NITEU|nr:MULTISPECIES: glutamine--tRNA ligase/YqeY domain fusion protein [Nitrosomonas]Q81ZS7.1 RecName: Full=Glutamine--tRNA ligase; AltName: Full=Glutaminyl-tRNA synthetase; Short=GlnRS [Nitrosomonas europaea ATCC 19718]CAD86268.1 Glutamyl-tRNA synthetase:Glutaminyl-tRNA synthetase GlnS [Nitrosomonas europaea ATCC 19718]CAD86275.1 Glutamyl-tRNA synthetase:Glutaminyl-tRNA synthetase GlnS [Nitrosomonas europaea ATCC 19718]SDW23145.1 glutaminyl-tRNA synthetase [Nitrosomonas europaea]SES83621.1 glutam